MRKLRQYEFVIEIARCGSVSKAAKYLNLSQPTLSKYLATLEEEIGHELFDRTTMPLKLTEAGRKYLAAANRILKIYNRLKDELEMINDGKNDSLIVGMSPTRAHFMLLKLMKNFKSMNSSARIVIKEDTVAALNEKLYRGELDLIISLKSDESKEFEEVFLFNEQTLLALPKKYNDYPVEKILRQCPFVSPGPGDFLSDVMVSVLYEYDREAPAIEAQSIESVLILVNEGMGVGFVPSYIRELCTYDNVVFKEIPYELKEKNKVEDNRQVCVFYKRDKTLTQAEKDLICAAKALI
ncbi:MAG: LysR family transcriptional regulator [Ruminococcaceae bacterium]|nr:LysR family transcriptional regulator [Oscillospiraceae bacterium]